MQYMHTMEYYSAIKTNELSLHTMKWMNFFKYYVKLVTKNTYCMIPLIWKVHDRWIHSWKVYEWLGVGSRNGDWLLIGTFSFMNDENILKLIVMMVVQLCEYMLTTIEVYTLNG